MLLYAASPQFYFLEAQLSHQAVATALLVALACLLVRSFDRGAPAGGGSAASRRRAAHPSPSLPAVARAVSGIRVSAAAAKVTIVVWQGLPDSSGLTHADMGI